MLENGKAVLRGVVSRGPHNAGLCYNTPDVFADVHSVIDFIRDVVVCIPMHIL